MLRGMILGLALALTLSHPTFANTESAGITAEASPVDAEVQLLKEAAEKFDNNDNTSARRQIDAVVASPAFAQLNPNQQYIALYMLGWLKVNSREKGALETVKRATAMTDFSTGRDWHLRLQADGQAGDDTDAILTLTTIAQRWPGSLAQVSDQFIRNLVNRTGNQKSLDDSRFQLLLALKAAFWQTTDPFDSPENEWVALTRGLLERGRVHDAQAAAESVTSYYAVETMLLDKQFDPVTQADPARFNLKNAMDHELVDLRAKVKANPDSLEGVNQLALMLVTADQPQAALDILDSAIARAKEKDGSAASFSDPDQLNWTYNQRALALLHLGKVDEAIALMKLGAARPENGSLNVSQQLNLAQIYEEEGRPAEAMAVMTDGDTWDLSPYGKMDMQGVRVCAAAQLHDEAQVGRSLSYMRVHLDDAPGWSIDAFICAGDIDSAAKIVIDELADPVLRGSALSDLQDAPFGPNLSPVVRARKQLMQTLYQRPDVKAAAETVGHHLPSPFQAWGMGR